MLSAPEWLPDPTGRHALRYWDGVRWSDTVRDERDAESDDTLPEQPLPAVAIAGWYPDTAGQHRLRYWSGVRWTDQITDEGAVASDPLDDGAAPPRATCAGWYPDPAGRAPVRWWDGTRWATDVPDRKGNFVNAGYDPSWPPPTTDRRPSPRQRTGFKMARKAGWNLGARAALKISNHRRCPNCGGDLHVVAVARPGHRVDYTPESTDVAFPPCAACGFVPPWSRHEGLYPDPGGTHEYRYWSGEQWSDQVADAGVGASDPLAGSTRTESGASG